MSTKILPTCYVIEYYNQKTKIWNFQQRKDLQHYVFYLTTITSITYNKRYKSQAQQIYYGVQGQVSDNMFRRFYSSTAIIRSSKVTLLE